MRKVRKKNIWLSIVSIIVFLGIWYVCTAVLELVPAKTLPEPIKVRPLFDLLKPILGLAWIPLMIVIFGIGIESKDAVVSMSVKLLCL